MQSWIKVFIIIIMYFGNGCLNGALSCYANSISDEVPGIKYSTFCEYAP